MSVIEKSEILSLVVSSGLPRRRALAQLGLAKSTYYRWLKRLSEGQLKGRKGGYFTKYFYNSCSTTLPIASPRTVIALFNSSSVITSGGSKRRTLK